MRYAAPPGMSARATIAQNASNRSAGTCESQKLKKTASYRGRGCQVKRSASMYSTLSPPTRARLMANTSDDASIAVT